MDDKSERKINLMTFAEIQKGYTITGGEKVPLLSEILDLCKDKVHVNIEIKGREQEVCCHVIDVVVACGMINQVHVSSFLHYHYKHLQEALQERQIPEHTIPFGYLVWEHKDLDKFDDLVSGKENIFAFPADFVYDSYALPYIFRAKEKGFKLATYFGFEYLENYQIYKRLITAGVDTIITNEPHLLLSFLDQKQQK